MVKEMKLRPGEKETLRSIHRMEIREGTKLLTKKGRRAIGLK